MSDNDPGAEQAEGVKITDKRKLDPETGAPRSSSDEQETPVSDLDVAILQAVFEQSAVWRKDRQS